MTSAVHLLEMISRTLLYPHIANEMSGCFCFVLAEDVKWSPPVHFKVPRTPLSAYLHKFSLCIIVCLAQDKKGGNEHDEYY